MEIHVTSRKIKVKSEIKEHAISEVIKLENIFDHIQRCDIIFYKDGKIKNTQVAEIVLRANGHFLTAKEKSDDMHKSIDMAVEKVEHQLTTYKSKLKSRKKNIGKKVLKKSDEE